MVDIVHRVGIKAPLDAAYRALATREGLADWWTTETEGDSTVGGTIRFRFTKDGVQMGGFDMKVLALEPNRRVDWLVVDGPPEWVGSRIGFDLRQEGEYAVVLFKHEGWKEAGEFMSHCSTKWATFLMSLKSLVETGKGQPSPNDVRVGDWH